MSGGGGVARPWGGWMGDACLLDCALADVPSINSSCGGGVLTRGFLGGGGLAIGVLAVALSWALLKVSRDDSLLFIFSLSLSCWGLRCDSSILSCAFNTSALIRLSSWIASYASINSPVRPPVPLCDRLSSGRSLVSIGWLSSSFSISTSPSDL